LQELDRAVDIKEMHVVVLQTAPKKAPRPDGFIGAFLRPAETL
jgi:hypothetical protein